MTVTHIAYFSIMLIILVAILLDKKIIMISLIGTFVVGLLYTKNLIQAISAMSRAITLVTNEFLGIIITIALITSMINILKEKGIENIFSFISQKYIKGRKSTIIFASLSMFILSLIIWPSPATVLIGALFLPIAKRNGVHPIYLASIFSIFGYGVALSGDYVIQGVPSITSGNTDVQTLDIVKQSIPLWLTMCISTILVYVYLTKRKNKSVQYKEKIETNNQIHVVEGEKKIDSKSMIVFFISFVISVGSILSFRITGDSATSLISGTAIFVCLTIQIIDNISSKSTKKIEIFSYLEQGFKSTIGIFLPIIILSSFFFLGNSEFSNQIFGENAPNFMYDLAEIVIGSMTDSKLIIILLQLIVCGLSSIDGSGFAGLALSGNFAQIAANMTNVNQAGLAAYGQIVVIWIAGGTLIPWSLAPAAVICGVNPLDVAKKNLIPVISGLVMMTIIAYILL